MYAIQVNGDTFTPNGRAEIADIIEAHNLEQERIELEIWAQQPERFGAYVSEHGTVTTWLGTCLGTVIHTSTYRNNLGERITSLAVRGHNGAAYHGRYGSDWSQFVNLRRSKN